MFIIYRTKLFINHEEEMHNCLIYYQFILMQ